MWTKNENTLFPKRPFVLVVGIMLKKGSEFSKYKMKQTFFPDLKFTHVYLPNNVKPNLWNH